MVVLHGISPSVAQALSTVSARFEPPQIVAGEPQSVSLLLSFFPGDGQAVTKATLEVPTTARILSAEAGLGDVTLSPGRLILDYLESPLGDASTDTLRLRVETETSFTVHGSLVTTYDTETQRRHRPSWSLAVAPALEASWELQPRTWYPGESVDVDVHLSNEDRRALHGLDVEWPSGVVAEAAEGEAWPLLGQQSTTLTFPLRLPARLPESIELNGTVQGGALSHSPLSTMTVKTGVVPVLQLEAGTPLLRGERGVVRLAWRTATGRPLPVTDLIIDIAGLEHVEVSGASLDYDSASGDARILAQDIALAPGQEHVIDVSLVPRRSGPLAFLPSYIPPDRTAPIPCARIGILAVVEPGTDLTTDGVGQPRLTDLELARQGHAAAWLTALDELPIPPQAAIRLEVDGRNEANWMVEEAVTSALLRRGVRLPMEEDAAAYELRFRVAASQAIYEPRGSIWNPFHSRQQRDASVSAFSRLLDPSGQIVWAGRVNSHGTDDVDSAAMTRLGGAQAVEQALVPPNQRALEAGLSGLIVGGLFFVFFSP